MKMLPCMAVLLVFGCQGAPCEDHEDSRPLHYSLGPEVVCESPTEGFGRFVEDAAERGLDLEVEANQKTGSCPYIPTSIVAQDVDLDGDVDLGFNIREGAPVLYLNQGDGNFERSEEVLPGLVGGRDLFAIAFADTHGDAFPELWATGTGFLAWAENLDGKAFSDWEIVYFQEDFPLDCHASIGFGDIDGDGDLDIALPGVDQAPYEGHVMSEMSSEWLPSFDRLFLNKEGMFEEIAQLSPAGEPALSLLQVFTDRDVDGDLDLLSTTDRAFGLPPQAFHRNDGLDENGLPILVNDAPEIGADLNAAAMGLASHDFNGDGRPDYCVTDVSHKLACMLSSPDGFYEAAEALGLSSTKTLHPNLPEDWDKRSQNFFESIWVSWGLAILDLDNDGNLDAAAVAGPTPDRGNVYHSFIHGWQPDWIWKGSEEGRFVEAVEETGFSDVGWNYGLVSADLDLDGHWELVVSPAEGRPQIWSNPCGSGAWLDIELAGMPSNTEGFGARVTVEAGGEVQLQEMHALLGVGQSPSVLHYGLGEAETVDRVVVNWPDGARSVVRSFSPNRRITIVHPQGI